MSAGTAYRRLAEPAYRGAFVERYDRLRPRPPVDLIQALAGLAPAQPPALVVDLGSGTGISTTPWSEHAERVIGVEQNRDMLATARSAPGVKYRCATAEDTGLADGCADVVTCAQSFHWMEPGPTLTEVARILRPSGVFAAYDYDWPPLLHWEVEEAFLAVIAASGVDPERPEKAGHLERFRESGHFRWVREFYAHACVFQDRECIALLPLVFGPVARRLAEGVAEEALGLDRFRSAVERRVPPGGTTLWWSYRVRVAVKT